jgi:hypothetical protein
MKHQAELLFCDFALGLVALMFGLTAESVKSCRSQGSRVWKMKLGGMEYGLGAFFTI